MSETNTYSAELAGLPFRQPVIDGFPDQTGVERDWRTATELVRRELIASPAVRAAARQFAAAPLAEDLPAKALGAYEQHGMAEHLTKLPLLKAYASLETVPDHLLSPDIQSAPALKMPSSLDYWMRNGNHEQIIKRIDEMRQALARNPGVSNAEKQLVATRYRYARDVKLLALSAELLDATPELTEVDGTLTGTLPSGTVFGIDQAALAATPQLLEPQTWLGRRQIKDRVHHVRIGDKTFIMKERKTGRHTDTMDSGHVDGLSAAQEYQTARHFNELSPAYTGGIKLTWEKPVGYVAFPDGFQFCLFESDPRLSEKQPNLIEYLSETIREHADDYTEEYGRTRDRALAIHRDGAILSPQLNKVSYRASAEPLSFDEFATIKAGTILAQAYDRFNDTVHREGYVNVDHDGLSIVPSTDPKAMLEVFGYDFEYYRFDAEYARGVVERTAQQKTAGTFTAPYASSPEYDPIRGQMREAAEYALYEANGYVLPNRDE